MAGGAPMLNLAFHPVQMKALSKAISDQCNAANKAAEESLRHFDPEAIHRLRVSLKQLRASFNLLLFAAGQIIAERDWKGAGKIFRQAGKIRERQLLRQRVLILSGVEEDSKKTVSAFLAFKEQAARRKFRHYLSDCGTKELKKLRRKMLRAAGKISGSDLDSYLNDLLKRIGDLRGKANLSEEELHALRKLLKELKYNRAVLEAALQRTVDGIFESDKLNAWEELIGKWHDEVIYRQRSEKLLKQMRAEGSVREVIAEMESFSSRNSGQLLREITEQFPAGTDGSAQGVTNVQAV
jgi:CHAD domain-containing protein